MLVFGWIGGVRFAIAIAECCWCWCWFCNRCRRHYPVAEQQQIPTILCNSKASTHHLQTTHYAICSFFDSLHSVVLVPSSSILYNSNTYLLLFFFLFLFVFMGKTSYSCIHSKYLRHFLQTTALVLALFKDSYMLDCNQKISYICFSVFRFYGNDALAISDFTNVRREVLVFLCIVICERKYVCVYVVLLRLFGMSMCICNERAKRTEVPTLMTVMIPL